MPGPDHVLTTCRKTARDHFAVILETNPDFPNAVSDEEIRGACRHDDLSLKGNRTCCISGRTDGTR
jgi:hypothetical protein